MTPEEVRKEIDARANLWALKCAISKIHVKAGFVEDFVEFESYYEKNFSYQKSLLLLDLEDSDPALAALVDDRENVETFDLDFYDDFL